MAYNAHIHFIIMYKGLRSFKVHSNIYELSLPLLLLGDSNSAFLSLLALGILEREESIPGDINSVDCKKSVLKGNKLQKAWGNQP